MSKYENDEIVFSRRAFVLGAAQFGFLGVLGWRLYYLQVQRAAEYTVLAEENRVEVSLLPPPRGRIFDREGRVLAENEQNFQVLFVPEQASDVDETLDRLSLILTLSPAQTQRLRDRIDRKPKFVPVTIADNLDWHHFSRINLEMPFLPGVAPQAGLRRTYYYGPDLAHLVGYVGAPTRDDIEDLGKIVAPQVGRSGIERKYEEDLRGQAGIRRVEVNAVGRIIRELARQDGVSGHDITLTIDASLQARVNKRLEGQSASVVVMDIRHGDVLALSSVPSFDPNHLSTGIDAASWRALTSDEQNPLLNKAIRGLYAPGSTFKMIVALAGLRAGAITPQENIKCDATYHLERETFHCWESQGHGEINLEMALAQSCDVFFYDLARRIGIKKIAAMARQFGLGARTDIELNGEKAGIVPDYDWKRANFETGWRLGETVIAGIGQGYLLTTPLQLAVMMARLASGKLSDNVLAVRPRLIKKIGDDEIPPVDFDVLDIDAAHLRLVHRGLYRAVNRAEGTAYGASLYVKGKLMSGKTGTVQVRRIGADERAFGIESNEQIEWRLRDHALFVGYAPHDVPRYAIAVLVEHGGSGTQIAAPIARDVLAPMLLRDAQNRGTI